MPQLSQVFNSYPMNVTLDSNGNGSILFQAVGCNARITNRSVRTSTAVKQAIASTYRGQIGDNYRIDATNSGSTGDNVTSAIELRDGESIIIVWTGGDPGATAYATFSGVTLPFDKLGGIDTGKGWNNPIAAGDGTLIYPALKSPNFITNISGWSLNRNGDVELNSAIIRGAISAGNGTVLLNAGGVKVTGVDKQFDINFVGGFLARENPDDGSYGNLSVASGSANGGILQLNPTMPSANGNSFVAAQMFGSNDLTFNAADDHPFLLVRSPSIIGKPSARINLWGQTGLSTVDNTTVDIVASGFLINGNDIGAGWQTGVGSAANSAAIGATETAVLTLPSFTYKAGRVYRVVINSAYSIATAGPNDPIVRIRSTANTQAYIARIQMRQTGTAYTSTHSGTFIIGAADVTTVLSLTLQASAAFTVALSAGAANPATVDIYDDGKAITGRTYPITLT